MVASGARSLFRRSTIIRAPAAEYAPRKQGEFSVLKKMIKRKTVYGMRSSRKE
jgi:hypothetical protein